MEEKVRNIIEKMREIKEQRRLTCQQIYEMSLPFCNDDRSISLTTVREMFGDKWELRSFKDKTISPIYTAMIGPDDQSIESALDAIFDSSKAKEYFLKWQASQELVEYLRLRMAEIEEHCEKEKAELSLLHDKNIDRLLTQCQKQDECQDKTIAVLEKSNEFLQQTIEVVRQSLCDERESKKRLYSDLKERMSQLQVLNDRITALEAYHNKKSPSL